MLGEKIRQHFSSLINVMNEVTDTKKKFEMRLLEYFFLSFSYEKLDGWSFLVVYDELCARKVSYLPLRRQWIYFMVDFYSISFNIYFHIERCKLFLCVHGSEMRKIFLTLFAY